MKVFSGLVSLGILMLSCLSTAAPFRPDPNEKRIWTGSQTYVYCNGVSIYARGTHYLLRVTAGNTIKYEIYESGDKENNLVATCDLIRIE